jgi:hypothetical protein
VDNTLPVKKALSIRQPWAWLIINGYKDIENRSWPTEYRGDFLVHVAKRFDKEGYQWVLENTNIQMPSPDEFQRGGVAGVVELVDCVVTHESIWFTGPYGFVLNNPRKLTFFELKGRLGFFEIE